MKNLILHSFILLLLCCYALVALTGQFQFLSHWLNSDAQNHAVTMAGDSQPFDDRPVLTQGKYVSLLERINVPSEALLGTCTFPDYQQIRYVNTEHTTSLPFLFSYIRFQPRDPPQA